MRYALSFVLFLLSAPTLAAQLDCRVVGISDGDTLTETPRMAP